MSESAAREWRFYLDDMIGFAEKVIAYTDGLDQAGFVANGLKYDATVRNLELIGEAASHIPEGVRAANPQLPWRLVIATRIHHHLPELQDRNPADRIAGGSADCGDETAVRTAAIAEGRRNRQARAEHP